MGWIVYAIIGIAVGFYSSWCNPKAPPLALCWVAVTWPLTVLIVIGYALRNLQS